MTQAESAYQSLRQRILAGDMAADEKITELGWAELLGIGRAAVREALRRLAGEGLVSKVGASYRVAGLRQQDVHTLRQLREIFEVGALRVCAAEGLSGERLAAIKEANEDFGRFIDGKYFVGAREADLRFHQRLVAAANNDRLSTLYESANLPLFQNYLAASGRALDDYDVSHAEHATIVQNLEKGDFDAAIESLSAHLRRGERIVTAET